MKNCPQCGSPRQGEAYICPRCKVFYSKLDEFLYAEQLEREKHSLKGRLKIILNAADRKQALVSEIKVIWEDMPIKSKIIWLTVFTFVFALVFGI
jgi:uncharacterized membrane protein YvbJ